MEKEQEQEMKKIIAFHEVEVKICEIIKEYESKHNRRIDMIDITHDQKGTIKYIKIYPRIGDDDNWGRYIRGVLK